MGGFFKRSQPIVTHQSFDGSTAIIPADPPAPIITRDLGMQSKTVREALEILSEAAPTMPGLNLFLDQQGYRSVSQSIRDISDQTRIKILQRAENLSLISCLASRALQIRTDLIVSEGFQVKATSDDKAYAARVQSILNEHWDLNEWDDQMFARVYDLGVTGEMIRRIPPLNVKTEEGFPFMMGRFKCGNILPHLVQKVMIDPWNYETITEIILQQYAFPGDKEIRMRVVRSDPMGLGSELSGNCFFWSVNRKPGASRGLSDLTPALEWLDLHDQSLFTDCERAAIMSRFMWDVTIENAAPAQLKQYAEELKAQPIRSGTVRVHSEKEKWDAIAPDLRLAETNQLREDIFLRAWGAMGLPRHWFVEAENTNRASAETMDDPIFAWARTRRRQLKKFLEIECRMALQVARESGRLQGVPQSHQKFSVNSRDPDRTNYEAMADSFTKMSQGLIVLLDKELIDNKSAASIVRSMAGTFGVDIPEAHKTVEQAAEKPMGGSEDLKMESVLREIGDRMNHMPRRLLDPQE